jgi:microsomal dipeptidase-like Zn-dependent dipeptidase
MIADLHCHYPMHLFPQDDRPRGGREGWLERLRNILQSGAVDLLAPIVNDAYGERTWRIDLAGLEAADAKLICSVLYWPPAEFDFSVPYGSPPLREYFEDVEYQMRCVEEEIDRENAVEDRVRIARRTADLADREHIVFVHCLEGALHLGPGSIDEQVRWLAERGVFYITVAHLFYRQVATNAPAIPVIPDWLYTAVFGQPSLGLTDLGREVVEAMHKYKVAIDITHMSETAIADTFALVRELDGEDPPGDFPVIATHAAMRSAGPEDHEYNLSRATAQQIRARGGVIGLIMAQHELGATQDAAASRALVAKHIEALEQACGDSSSIAFGTDLDGFITPTIDGIESGADLATLTQWVEDARQVPGDAGAILYGNALRVITQIFESRARAFARLGIPY